METLYIILMVFAQILWFGVFFFGTYQIGRWFQKRKQEDKKNAEISNR